MYLNVFVSNEIKNVGKKAPMICVFQNECGKSCTGYENIFQQQLSIYLRECSPYI